MGIDLLDYTLRNVILGSAVLGVVGGVLGSFALLRRQSLMGDALAHAALPGICIMFLLSGTKAPELLLLGAGLSGWLGTLALLAIVRGTRIKEDAALGAVLSVFFGFGILLLTRIQRGTNANQSGLDRYLFGQAATLMERDILVMAMLAAVALGVVALLYKELKLFTFDRSYAASLGYPVGVLDVILTSLIVLAVLIGLQTVGVVLMVSMLIAPAAAARQWTDRLGWMLVLSALFGATAGFVGAVLSSLDAQVPTGPLIVLAATSILLVSLLFAPGRGLVRSWLHRWRQRRRIAVIHLLAEIEGLLSARRAKETESRDHREVQRRVRRQDAAVVDGGLAGVSFMPEEVADRGGHPVEEVRRGLAGLVRRGLVLAVPGGTFHLTSKGAVEARRAGRNQRLWQAYLASQLDLPAGDVHLDVGDLERTLPPGVLLRLQATISHQE